jgi:hypothetical protein
MQELQDLKISILSITEQKKALLARLRAMFVEKSISLEHRWDLFCAAHRAGLLPTYGYQQSLPTLDALDVSWYDDFYKDRYALVEWEDIVQSIQGSPKGLAKFLAVLDQIKEEILAAGYGSFENDW